MTFSVFTYFAPQSDGVFGDARYRAAASSVRWSVAFPSIPTAYCERRVKESSAVKDFYAHFNPKYDVYQPSHRSDWLTATRIATVLSKRVVFDAYLAFANEVNYAIEQAEEPDDLDWGKIIQGTVFDPILTYCSSGVQEWIAEGIRILYAKHIIAHWHRRTAWKFLKGSVQSSLRKYSREGILAFGRVCWTEARGNSVFIAASTTWRLIKQPWMFREVYMQQDVDVWYKVSHFLRSSACCGIGVGLGRSLWLSFGGKPGVERWTPEGGKEKSIPTAIFLFWALGYNVADSLMQALLRPQLEVYLGLAPPAHDEDDEDGALDADAD